MNEIIRDLDLKDRVDPEEFNREIAYLLNDKLHQEGLILIEKYEDHGAMAYYRLYIVTAIT